MPSPTDKGTVDWKARAEKAEADLERLELAHDDAVDFAAAEPEKIARSLPEPVRAAVIASVGTEVEEAVRLTRDDGERLGEIATQILGDFEHPRLQTKRIRDDVERDVRYLRKLSARVLAVPSEPNQPPEDREDGGLEEADGTSLIASERRRQVEAEGWTPEHDDEHEDGALAYAAACYAAPEPIFVQREGKDSTTFCTPWPRGWVSNPAGRGEGWRPWGRPKAARITQLVRAGALIAAEIDRLLRVEGKSPATQQQPEEDVEQMHSDR